MVSRICFIILSLFATCAQAKSLCIGMIDNQTKHTVQLRGVTMEKKSPDRAFVEIAPGSRVRLDECPDGQRGIFRTSLAKVDAGTEDPNKPISFFFYDSPDVESRYTVSYNNVKGDTSRFVSSVIYDPTERDHHDCYVINGDDGELVAFVKITVSEGVLSPRSAYECMTRSESDIPVTSFRNLK